MTREELRDYVDEQRSLGNIPYHVYSTLIDGIDTLEQEPILDKIRAEIAEYGSIMVSYAITKDTKTDKGIEKLVSDVLQQAKEEVLEIIDNYKAESEPQESEEQQGENTDGNDI